MEGLGNTHPLAEGIQSVITLPAFHGAGGGKPKEPRPPVEAPDSLHSTAYARIDDVLSEGPIRGLVNGLKSIYFNGTPLENPDGTLNFHNVVIDSRLGTQDQDYITGFGTVESEVGVGVRLMFGSPWTQALNNTALDGVRIRISTPMLQQGDAKTGDTNGTAVGYKIEVATDGGAYVPVLPYDSINGKTTSKYERSHRIDLPPATNGWLIRVTRTTPESSTNLVQSETYIESFTELVDAKLRYPNTAHVATIIDAKQFQSIPTRGFDTYGRIVQVPSNYNPETREYAGLWDGTFKPAWTDNPAWVFYDLITHHRYGLGHLVTPEMFNKWAAYKIARYCDQMVPDGRGGMEPRFTCNLFLQVQEDAYKVITDMAGVFRGMAYYASGSIQPVADMPDDPVFLYTPANVKDGRFVYNGSGLRARHTVALVSWNDQTDFGRSKVEYVEDLDGIGRYGVNQTEVIAVGCTSRGQARRYGKMLLATERLETDLVNFAVGLDGTLAAPGQIIRVADPLRAGRRIGGRVASATTQTIVVDALPSPAPVAGDLLSVIGTGGVLMQRVINNVNPATRAITVNTTFDSAPVPDSMWAVESAGAVTKLYRVLTVGEETDGSGYTISALEHNPEKFDFVDLDDPIEGETTPPITRPPGVGNLTITSRVRMMEYESELVLAADWTRPETAVDYEVQWRKGGGEWSPAQMQRETHWELPGAFPGEYVVKVTPFNAQAQPGPATVSAPYLIADPEVAPPAIGEIQGDVQDAFTQLAQEIEDRLLADQAEAAARVAAITAEAQARVAAIAAEAAARAAELQALSDELWGVIDGLGAQIGDVMQADEHVQANAYPVGGDLVQSGGKLYRSLQPVPAGIPITDTAYWQLIGDYASLGEAVAATVSRVNVLTSSVTALDGEISAINSLVTDLQSAIGDVEGEVAAQAGILSLLGTRVTETEAALAVVAEDITGLTAAIAGKADASALNALTVRVTETEDSIEAVVEDITDLQAALPGLASVGALDALTVRVTENEDGIEALIDDVTALSAEVDGKADAGALNALTTRVTETESGIDALASDVSALEAALPGLATVGALNALAATVSQHGTDISAISSDITSLTAALAGKASVAALNGLTATVNDIDGVVDAHTGLITSLQSEVRFPFQATLGWQFIVNHNGFQINNGSLSTTPATSNFGASAITTTSNDPQFYSPIVAINGADNPIVRALIRVRDPATWEGRLYWSDTTSGYHALNTKLSNITAAPLNEYFWVEWDMSATSVWRTRTINQLRFDFIGTSGRVVDVREIAVGNRSQAASGNAARLLESRVQQTENGIVANAADMTTLVAQLNGQLVPGKNLLVNPSGARGTGGWRIVSNGGTMRANVQPGNFYIEANSNGNVGNHNIIQDFQHPDLAGKQFTFTTDMYVDGANFGGWYGIDTVAVNSQTGAVAINTDVVSLTAAYQWQRISVVSPVYGPGFDTVRVRIRAYNNAFFQQMAFRNAKLEVGAVATPFSDDVPYSTATALMQAQAQQTADGQIRLMASYSIALDVNGYITGWVFNNDGSTGTFDVRADRFSVTNPSGGAGLTWEAGVLWNRGTSHSFIIGQNFGTSGDLIAWAGPNPTSPGAVSKSNAVFYITNGGDGYFGGSLSAGILRNAVTTTTIQTIDADVTNGPFGTNGNPRQVVISFARNHVRTRNATGPTGYVAGAGANTATIYVYRRIAGITAWVHTWTLNVTGSWYINNEVDGPDVANGNWGGSITVNDQSPAANTVEYVARVVGFTEQTITHTSGGGDTATNITQSLSIISTEP